MNEPLHVPDKYDPGACAAGWFRVFERTNSALVRLDIPPSRDEHVNSLASRLLDVAGGTRGRLELDLSVVEEYSWTWVRALIDLSVRCADLGGALCLTGMNEEGERLLRANKTLMDVGRAARSSASSAELLPIGGQPSVGTTSIESHLSARTGRRLIRSAA